MTTRYDGRMSCEPVTLSDGSTVLVNVKPGQKLLPEDVAALEEFRRLLQIADTGETLVPAGYPVGTRHQPPMGQPKA